MREFLLELYLKHGDRGFGWRGNRGEFAPSLGALIEKDYITIIDSNNYEQTQKIQFYLTPKAIEYLKQNDS